MVIEPITDRDPGDETDESVSQVYSVALTQVNYDKALCLPPFPLRRLA